MKRQILLCLYLSSILLLSINLVKAQEGAAFFDNGITIATKIERLPDNSSNYPLRYYISSSKTENIMYRIIKDEKNKIYLGYDIEVKETGEPEKYNIFIKPLSSESMKNHAGTEGYTEQVLPKYPNAIEVNEGDTVTLELMENPTTKQKLVEYIKVLYKPNLLTEFFAERMPIRDFTIDAIQMQLVKFEVFANNQSFLKVKGGAAGSNLFLYLKGKGRFIFSIFPHAGYDFQKIGSIENNRILFKYDGVDYKIAAGEQIIGTGGHWNLWVLHDPNYKPRFDPDEPYEVGGFDKMDFKISK